MGHNLVVPLIKRIKQPHGAATTTHHWVGARSRATWKSPTSESHFLCVSAALSGFHIFGRLCVAQPTDPPSAVGQMSSNSSLLRQASSERVSGQMGGGGGKAAPEVLRGIEGVPALEGEGSALGVHIRKISNSE
jgi:hypothetical protein